MLASDGRRLLGWLNHRDVLRAYTTKLHEATSQPGPVPAPHTRGAAAPAQAQVNRPATADLSHYGGIDVELTGTCPPAGQQIADLAWPPPAHLLALRRDGQITSPQHPAPSCTRATG